MSTEQKKWYRNLIKELIDECENDWYIRMIYGLLDDDWEQRHAEVNCCEE